MEEKQDQLLSMPTQLLLSLEHIRMLMSHYPAASSLFLYAPYWVGGWGGAAGVGAKGRGCLWNSWSLFMYSELPSALPTVAGKRRTNDLEASPSLCEHTSFVPAMADSTSSSWVRGTDIIPSAPDGPDKKIILPWAFKKSVHGPPWWHSG